MIKAGMVTSALRLILSEDECLLREDLKHIRHITQLKLNVRAQLLHQWLKPLVTPMLVDQLTKSRSTTATV